MASERRFLLDRLRRGGSGIGMNPEAEVFLGVVVAVEEDFFRVKGRGEASFSLEAW